jgi:hypothetical protein
VSTLCITIYVIYYFTKALNAPTRFEHFRLRNFEPLWQNRDIIVSSDTNHVRLLLGCTWGRVFGKNRLLWSHFFSEHLSLNMAASPKPTPDFLQLCGGVLWATFGGYPQLHQVCCIGAQDDWAIVNGSATYFNNSFDVDWNEYFIVSKVKQKNKQAFGLRRGTKDDWKPIELDEDNVPHILDQGKRLNIIREDNCPWTTKQKWAIYGGGSLLSATTAVALFPVVVAGLGFGAGGIASGSVAAAMMSKGIAGVAALQSISAAGMGLTSTLIVGGTAAATTATAVAAPSLVYPSYVTTKDGARVKVIPVAKASAQTQQDPKARL